MQTPIPQSNPPGRHVPISLENVAAILHATVGELRSALHAAGIDANDVTLATAYEAYASWARPSRIARNEIFRVEKLLDHEMKNAKKGHTDDN